MNKAKSAINSNSMLWERVYGYIKRDKQEFINELKSKGHKLSGRESIKKLTNLIMKTNVK